MNLTTEAQLAEMFGLTVEQIRDLRKRKKWPHVQLNRFSIRFTDAHVAEIVASHTVKPEKSKAAATGLSERSAARSS